MQVLASESAPRGKIVVATRDYLPGELILEEEPLMMVPKAFTEENSRPKMPDDCNEAYACYAWFKNKVSPELKERVFSLFHPPECKQAERIGNFARAIKLYTDEEHDRPYPMPPDEVESMSKLAAIMTRNNFSIRGDQLLYVEMASFAPSCAGNCHCLIEVGLTAARCSATKHIQAGEEITFSHMPMRDLVPTHVRRRQYLGEREFTCHCPRCDAPGDDTRQFDCFDPACKGVMMVCQPIDEEEVSNGLQYTGVEYVEPHLMPCTVCHRAAPLEYQQDMLQLETELTDLVDKYTRINEQTGVHGLWEEIYRLKLPMRHSFCLPLHKIMLENVSYRTFRDMSLYTKDEEGRGECRRRVQRLASAYISAQAGITPVPHARALDAMREVSHHCITSCMDKYPALYLPAEARAHLQRNLRVHLIFVGRDVANMEAQCGELHEHILKALQELPVPQEVRDMQVCAFCEESPTSAFMKRSRCGACKKVMYCSAGCQKAHWKLHKKTCEGTV